MCEGDLSYIWTKGENIGFYRYMGNLILQIYWDILRNIGEYFDTKYR